MKKRTATFLLIITTTFIPLVLPISKRVHAISCSTKIDIEELKDDELQDFIDECSAKVEEQRGKIETLTGELNFLDSQIQLTEVRIQNALKTIQTKKEKISQLSSDITDLAGRITKISEAISFQQKVFEQRLRERYKSLDTSPMIVLLGSDTIDSLVKKTQYLRVMEGQDQKMIDQMDQTKIAYSKQKELFEDTKQKEEDLQRQLEKDKANLDAYNSKLEVQKGEKNNLIKVTQNSEEKYQKLLEDAKEQLAQFKGFTSSAGGGVIDSNGFGKGKEGWYFSQRDSRWASKKIGDSSENIMDVGCLVTSVAMVYKSQGSNVTPETIAKRDIFLSNTAYMIVPIDFSSYWGSYSGLSSQIDASLKKDIPVIIGVHAGPYGTHFVVLSKKDGSDYIMYDPWYGPDLKLSSYYSKSTIFEAIIY